LIPKILRGRVYLLVLETENLFLNNKIYSNENEKLYLAHSFDNYNTILQQGNEPLRCS